jgi:formylglycine-generating enzyme required for sulfatase activity
VVPWLRAERQRRWLVLEPFKPGLGPFGALRGVLREHLAAELLAREPQDGDGEAAGLSRQLHSLSSSARAPVVLVIDQFEELLADGNQEGERFLGFLEGLLSTALAEVVVLATMRTDFLAPLQSRWPQLLGLASTMPLEPIRLEDFGELISGPAKRSKLELQPGLRERLVSESGGCDALPLLAFTLEKLWQKWKERGSPMLSPRGERWDLTVADYEALGGVAGAVSSQAKLCWNPETSHEADSADLREAFVYHLVTLNEEGQVAKRAAELQKLPERSRPIVQRLVNRRLLVSDAGRVEIAHEALLRTWEPLVDWIEEGKEELLQRRRVRRLGEDLMAEAPQQRCHALEQLAALAAAGGSEGLAVQKEAAVPLTQLLAATDRPLAEREDAALVLALIGAEEPLRQCLADTTAPVALRRRAAESLGLLAKRIGRADPQAKEAIAQRQRIAAELEHWLRSDALNLLVRDAEGWAEHDARLPLLQGASRGLQLAASAELPLFGSGPGLVVPMLTLTALEEGDGLRIVTEVVEVPVWQLPLPAGEQLELVLVPAGEYTIGSPRAEAGRDGYSQFLQKCEGMDVEALRPVRLMQFALLRMPISQGQWLAVVEAVAAGEWELEAAPGKASPASFWERHGQPGVLAVDSVSWNDSKEWLQWLNRWLNDHWRELGGSGEAPSLTLPSESQWEVACRGDAKTPTPFHFGATLDASWARYDASYTYGRGRKGAKFKQPWTNGSSGLVNRWGLAELHGQLFEWCGDLWNRDPRSAVHRPRGLFGGKRNAEAAPMADGPVDQLDPALRGNQEQRYRLLRGGSWFDDPRGARAAFRGGVIPVSDYTFIGLRPCCPSPPGSLLGS